MPSIDNIIEYILLVPAELFIVFSFLASFLEAVVIVGLFVPGTVLLSFIGVFAQQAQVAFWQIYLISVLASILGWWVSYFLGKKSKIILQLSLFKNIFTPNTIKQSENFFIKYGGISLLFARFLGPMRPVFPFAGGIFGLPHKTFWIWNITSSFLWNFLYIGAGYILGAFAIEYLETYSKAASIFSIFVAIIVIILSVSRIRVTIVQYFYKFYIFVTKLFIKK